MTTLSQLYDLRYGASEQFQRRVTAAIATAAVTIQGESPETANHAARLAWARSVFTGDTRAMADKMMWGIMSNPTVAAAGDATTDGDLIWVVAQLVNTFA